MICRNKVNFGCSKLTILFYYDLEVEQIFEIKLTLNNFKTVRATTEV